MTDTDDPKDLREYISNILSKTTVEDILNDKTENNIFAKHDRAHCLCPRLFKIGITQKNYDKEKLDIRYQFSESESLRFLCAEPLGVFDMRLLQRLIAYSGPNGMLLDTTSESYKRNRLFIDPIFEMANKDGLVLNANISFLLNSMGYEKSGQNIKKIIDSMERLANVTISVSGKKISIPFQLLSYCYDIIDQKYYIVLNPRLTDVIYGTVKQFVRLSIGEDNSLKTDIARVISQRLCAWIDPGKSGKISIDTLYSYLWDPKDDENISPLTIRSRKTKIRKAVLEFADIGWKVKKHKKDHWEFIRADNICEIIPQG